MSADANQNRNPFSLTSRRAAKVSEISEATSASGVPAERRVNFHIGHPVEDDRLTHLYQRLVFGLPLQESAGAPRSVEALLRELQVEEPMASNLRFLARAAERSIPYLPRGGFSRRDPGPLAPKVQEWLGTGQEEALDYDLGLRSGRSELTFVSGGALEAVRMLLGVLASDLEVKPAHLHTFRLGLPSGLAPAPGLRPDPLPQEEGEALSALETSLRDDSAKPHFLFVGVVMSETARRRVRRLSLAWPLFIIEVNDAPNHHSLGREAGLSERVLRILTPAAIDPRLRGSSVAIAAGPAELIGALERTHFELKGTPSATELELCAFLLKSLDRPRRGARPDRDFNPGWPDSALPEGSVPGGSIQVGERLRPLANAMESLSERIEGALVRGAEPLLRASQRVEEWAAGLGALRWVVEDPFSGMSALEVVESTFERLEDPSLGAELERGLLAAFLSHHPEYEARSSVVVSGSTRTALGILGRHCGITEVVIPDLSWTYEHCFPVVEAVPLSENLDLDVDAVIALVREKLERDSTWRTRGAVVLNNPHNASGAVFPTGEVTRLVRWLLERGVWVVDDLSYLGVGPGDGLQDYRTVRQIVARLQRSGALRPDQAQKLITVQSFSKTDCLAGARLAVAEILDPRLLARFREVVGDIRPNLGGLLLAYLFYRRHPEEVQAFWSLRDKVLGERMEALERAVREVPEERNPYGLRVEAPEGSMYPRLVVDRLPAGVSLDWLASLLAPRGVGLLPFSTFARTARGFDLARKSFRLTLGGKDGPFSLGRKARRVTIDLNRLIEDQSTLYTLQSPPVPTPTKVREGSVARAWRRWSEIRRRLEARAPLELRRHLREFGEALDPADEKKRFQRVHLSERLDAIEGRLKDRAELAEELLRAAGRNGGLSLLEGLERETRPVSLAEKRAAFRGRLFDRTVHPTQAYSLRVDAAVDRVVRALILDERVPGQEVERLARELAVEYVGANVAISSDQEAEELVLDLRSLIDAEMWADLSQGGAPPTLLSFWGDWDGSTRPSGQGHRLAAGALLEDVTELSRLLQVLEKAGSQVRMDPELAGEIRRLEARIRSFWGLLNQITELTAQLERRYLRVLPFDVEPSFWRRLGMALGLARDPVSVLWQHNDRLERRMLRLRGRRLESLEHYFRLNRRLQETLRENLERIGPLLGEPRVALQVGFYRNALRRFVLTPRIHQRMILAQDQFAIDTTVHNMLEINRLASKYGSPGLVLAIQVSMSSDPEALIALDRKLLAGRREVLRRSDELSLPGVWVIPLFEHLGTIRSLDAYLDRIWEYAVQSRRVGQESPERFKEILCEVFFAGSDLSQQIGQAAGAAVYREAKYHMVRWLSEHKLTGEVRIKLGSGEPAQRQGGYYDPKASRPPVLQSKPARRRLRRHLNEASRRAWEWARTPLRGVQAGGEFRTFQSNLAERLRRLPLAERVRLLYHVWRSQGQYALELERAVTALEDTRMHFEAQTLQELATLTMGRKDSALDTFLDLTQKHFRQILYGREEDVVGIHVISHFLSRAMPPLRDRPVVRPGREPTEGEEREILGRIARTLPMSRHGSMLRAIGHNRAQTMMLGVNQLTAGLFKAVDEFRTSGESRSERERALEDGVLPQLPVYDLLHTLRVYHDPRLEYVRALEILFPAGNSAFVALREDNDLIPAFVPHLQRELLRRSGMDVEGVFSQGQVRPELLPSLRPDLAVLLQRDLFNTDMDALLAWIGEEGDEAWEGAVRALLSIPKQVQRWRSAIWRIVEVPIRAQVESFVGLALAVHSLGVDRRGPAAPLAAEPGEVQRLGAQVAELLRGAVDDPLRQFLVAAVQYLTELPQTSADVPLNVVRALRDVERIVTVEEQALGEKQQALVRFYLLRMARLCGENG